MTLYHRAADMLDRYGRVDGVMQGSKDLHRHRQINLRHAAAGTPVNLEFDMVGKYVARTAELATRTAS